MKIKPQFKITPEIDTRKKPTKAGLLPIVLRVYSVAEKKYKRYTIARAKPVDFYAAMDARPKAEAQHLRITILQAEAEAVKLAESIKPFGLDEFDRKYRNKVDVSQLAEIVNLYITEKKIAGRTAETYWTAYNSLAQFAESKGILALKPDHITKNFLCDYERAMIQAGRSQNTVGIYLRGIKAVFNFSVKRGLLDDSLNPFRPGEYRVPAVRGHKRALNKKTMNDFRNALPQTPEQEKAKDFFLFSYLTGGMNIKDIATLRPGNIIDGYIVYFRAKTANTARENLRPIKVKINELTKAIIEKYRANSGPYLFGILSGDETPDEQNRKIKNFTRFINQHIKRLAKANNLPAEISTYWARHTAATELLNHGFSVAQIGSLLGHQNESTTRAYLSSLNQTVVDSMSDALNLDTE